MDIRLFLPDILRVPTPGALIDNFSTQVNLSAKPIFLKSDQTNLTTQDLKVPIELDFAF